MERELTTFPEKKLASERCVLVFSWMCNLVGKDLKIKGIFWGYGKGTGGESRSVT